MRALILTTCAVLFSLLNAEAQQLNLIDGVYQDQQGEVYSGSLEVFHNNGERKALFSLKEGKIQNMALFYSESGHLVMTGAYTDNLKDGIWLTYTASGKIASKAEYRNGKKVGEWTIKSPYSEVCYKLNFSNDELSSAYAVD